jgi:hypothetical protein
MAVLKQVKVLFSNVVNVDDFSQKFQIVVSLTEAQAADAESAGLKVKTKEYDGKTQYQVTFKSKFRPRIVKADGKTDLDLAGSEIGRGSLVSVQFKMREWITPAKKQGVSSDLIAVQVLTMTPQGAMEFESAGEADDDSEFDSEY